jgi:hypothetical protein
VAENGFLCKVSFKWVFISVVCKSITYIGLRNFTLCIISCKHEFWSLWPHGPQYFPLASYDLYRSGVETHASQALWRGDHTCMLLYPTLGWKVKVGPATTACHRYWEHVLETQSTNGHMTTSIITCWVCQSFSFTRTPLLREYLSDCPSQSLSMLSAGSTSRSTHYLHACLETSQVCNTVL